MSMFSQDISTTDYRIECVFTTDNGEWPYSMTFTGQPIARTRVADEP